MKEFENKIYRRLLAPVLACLVLALAGCSQDAAEPEAPSSPTGGTYLTIVTRGITTTDSDLYEDYVGSLRVMAFDNEGNRVINELVTDLPQEDDTDSYVTITEELPAGTITSGVYTFYFVANEVGYNITETQTLTQALDVVATKSALEAIQVKTEMTADGQVKPTASQMLMSTGPYPALIREGENNRIGDDNHIKLVRAFAKAQLALKLPEGNTSQEVPTVTSVTLNGSIPDYFYLIPGNKAEITSTTSFNNRTISADVTKTLFNEDLDPADYFYVSETIYLPERYLTNNIEENALQYSITIEDNNYSAPIADGTEAPVDYNIIRNCAYTTIGTYRQEVLSDFNLLVVPWDDEKVIEVPAFE